MRVVAISDTHSFHDQIQVPDGDILIHAGDICGQGTYENVEDFNEWLANLPHKHKVVIAGNHDLCFEWDERKAREILTNAHYLQDEFIEIEGLKIYGSPWQPRFFDWAFNLNRGTELAEVWSKIPKGLDILVTHGPPFGILDEVAKNGLLNRAGCQDLMEAIEEKKPKYHIFGHIHEGYGQYESHSTHFINASVCTGRYIPINDPIVIDI